MSDIAQLGISVDSSGVTTATAALTGLAGAAQKAGPAVTALNAAAGPATAALGAMGGVAKQTQASVTILEQMGLNAVNKALREGVKAANGVAHAHGGMSTQAMAAMHSMRSMAEGVAMGMSPIQVLTQQFGHLSYAASGSGGLVGAFKEAGGVLAGIVTPARLAAVGIVGVAVGFGLAAAEVSKSMLTLETLSNRSGISMSRLFQLQGVASVHGISTADSQKGLTQISQLTRDAQHSTGALFDLFQANGTKVGTTADNFSKIADFVKNAASDEQRFSLLQQLGLPPTREWLDYLSQGSVALSAAADKMSPLNDNARAVADRWKEIQQYTNSWKVTLEDLYTNTVVKLLGAFSSLGAAINTQRNRSVSAPFVQQNEDFWAKMSVPSTFDSRFGAAPTSQNNTLADQLRAKAQQEIGIKPTAESAPKPTAILDDLKKQNQLESQRIGILGQTASVEQQVRAVELQIQAARWAGVSVSAKEAQTLKDNARDRALGVDTMQASVDALHTEAGAFTMLAGDAAAYTAVQNKLNQARRDGQPLTAQNIADIKTQASVLGQATQQMDLMKSSADLLGNAFNTFHTQLQNGAKTATAFRQAALSMVNSIETALINLAAKNLVQAIFSGGGGNILGSIAGLFSTHHTGYGPGDTSPMRSVSLGEFIGAPRFHSGIGPGEVPAIIRDDESVLTPGQMRALGGAINRGGNVTIAPTINVGGAPGDDGQARKFAAMISDQVKRVAMETIRDQRRPGGILA